MNDLTNPQQTNFNRPATALTSTSLNAGAVAIESERAIAEAQGKLTLAKRFPRDLNAAYAELMEACKIPAMANVAFYALPRGGKTIVGPSIRLAEEIARVYGNFSYGHRELSRTAGKSEVEVWAWDMQTNNYSSRQITVMHTMDTKEGQKPLRDQKDIDDKIANVASKQSRGRILAMMPKWLVEDAMEECRKTLAGANNEPINVRVRKMTQAFAKFGVKVDHLERRLGHKLDDVTTEELDDLVAIYTSIKDGERVSDYFPPEGQAEDGAPTTAAATIAATAAAAKKPAATTATVKKTTTKAADKPASTPKDEVQAPVPAADPEPEAAAPEASDAEVEAANQAANEVNGEDDDPLF